MSQTRKWCLIEIPDHQGVFNVGGRVGACYGPVAFRRVFERMGGAATIRDLMAHQWTTPQIGSDVSANHRRAADCVREAHKLQPLSLVIGGGHDHGFSHLWGIREALGPEARLGCINIDAHLDLRKPSPKPSSGSPFYLAIEQAVLQPKDLVEFGIQPHCNAPALWDYVARKNIEVVPWKALRFSDRVALFQRTLEKLARRADQIVISFDLDSVAQAFAPGVSAPQSEGFHPSEIMAMMEIAGSHAQVLSLGIFELNPEHDRDDATARVAALSAYYFLDAALSRP
jgi:arginase family enzyme